MSGQTWATCFRNANERTWKKQCTTNSLNELLSEWMTEWANECMNEWSNEWRNEWIHKPRKEGMNGWVNDWMNKSKKQGRTKGVNQRMNGWRNGGETWRHDYTWLRATTHVFSSKHRWEGETWSHLQQTIQLNLPQHPKIRCTKCHDAKQRLVLFDSFVGTPRWSTGEQVSGILPAWVIQTQTKFNEIWKFDGC